MTAARSSDPASSTTGPGRRSRARAAVAAVVLMAGVALVLPSWSSPATAATGTVKIDNEVPQNNNNPHQGCGILVELYGWTPAGPASAYVVFSGQGGGGAGIVAGSSPASGAAHPILFTAGSGNAGTPDGFQAYEVDTTGLVPNASGEFHIDVDVYDTATGTLLKQKVIWVETCNSDLAVDKTGPATYVPGGTGSYAMTVTNNGPNRAPGPITLTDALPAGETATAASGTGWSCTVTPSLVTCTHAGDLARGQSAAPVTVSVSYGASATGDLTDTARVSSTRPDLVPGNDSDSVTTKPAPYVDLAVAKTATPSTAVPGGQVTYQLTATNQGTATVTAFTLTDTLGTGLTWVSTSTSSAGLSCSTTTCTYTGALAPGSAVSATLVAQVAPSYTGLSVTNQVAVAAAGDVDPSDDTASVTTPVTHPTDLAVVKTASPATVRPGDALVYTVTVTNQGLGPVAAFIVTDALPADLALVSVVPGSPTLACTGTTTVSCTFSGPPLLAPGASVSFVVNTTVRTTSTATSVTNTAVLPPDSDPSDDSSSVTTPVTQPADVALTKTASPAAVEPGDTVTYTLTATNDGVLPLTSFTIADPLGAGLTWVSTTTSSPGLTCAASAPVSCTYAGSLTSGQSVTATVTATVPASYTGTSVTNAAVAVLQGDADPSNDSASVTTPVTQPLDLALAKTASPASTSVGELVTYVLTATNDGVLPVTSSVVTDPLGPGLAWVSTTTTSPGLSCASGAPVVCTYAGSLASGQSVTATVVARVLASWTGTSVLNTATSATPGDVDASDDSSSASVAVVHPDLVMAKSGPATAVAGDAVAWVLQVSNEGDGAAPGPLTVTDPSPAGVTVTAAGGTDWSCTVGATVTCTSASGLAAGATAAPITVSAVLDEDGTVTNTATVAVATGETDASDNTDSAVTEVTPAPVGDLAIDKAGPAEAVAPGDDITWTITVSSTGTGPVSGAVVTDALADGLTLVSASGAGWVCADGPTVSCRHAAAIAPGDVGILSVTATLAEDYAETTVVNTAVVGPADATDDNSDTDTTDVDLPFTGGGGGPTVTPPTGGGGLPTTGAEALRLVALAALLLAGGALLSVAGTRRRSA